MKNKMINLLLLGSILATNSLYAAATIRPIVTKLNENTFNHNGSRVYQGSRAEIIDGELDLTPAHVLYLAPSRLNVQVNNRKLFNPDGCQVVKNEAQMEVTASEVVKSLSNELKMHSEYLDELTMDLKEARTQCRKLRRTDPEQAQIYCDDKSYLMEEISEVREMIKNPTEKIESFRGAIDTRLSKYGSQIGGSLSAEISLEVMNYKP